MKLCYISVYKDGTGYAAHSVRNMLALEAGGIDVVARAVSLSVSKNYDLANRVAHLEKKNTDNVDVVIQQILPHLFEYKSGAKNIGMFSWETTNFTRSNWAHCCNIMDEIWVHSLQNKQAAIDSGVKVPIKILPCPCDVSRFETKLEPLSIPQCKNRCVFYTVGELTRRKNLVAMLRAFYGAFTSRDDVALIVKTHVPGQSKDQSMTMLQMTIRDIKKSLHTYMQSPYYPPVIGITDFMPDNEIDRLHAACDVFVSTSHGEAVGIGAFDAMGFGNPVILGNWGYFPELTYAQADRYWESENQKFKWPGEIGCGWLVKGGLTPCFGVTNSFPDLYTGEEKWYAPDLCHLMECMQKAYAEWQDKKLFVRGKAAQKRAFEFSYEKVGAIARKLLGI